MLGSAAPQTAALHSSSDASECCRTASYSSCPTDADTHGDSQQQSDNREDGSDREKEKEKEKEEKSNEYEDALLDLSILPTIELPAVRTYFHHHCAIHSLVVIDKPTQPPKRRLI